MCPVIDGNIPLALLDATRAGTGKGLLAQVFSIIATGRQSPTMTEWRNEEETRKQITSQLMTGRLLHIIDNVTRPIDSPALASMLTAEEWTDRLLSTNQTVNIPSAGRGVWCATGNNIVLGGDMPRRCYRVRIDAQMTRPAQRDTWKHDPLLEWLRAERVRILHAALTICRAWFARGRPATKVVTMGSFETWARTIGGVLALDPTESGVGRSFLGNAEEVWEEGDSEAEEWLPFLQELEVQMNPPFTASQAAKKCKLTVSREFGYIDFGATALAEELPRELAAHLTDADFNKRLGMAFRTHMGTRYGEEGWRIERVGLDPKNMALWRVAKDAPHER